MLIPGTVLQNRYRIIRQIGGGGQALVYLAEDTNLGIWRAIKELTPDPTATPQERQAAYDQFQREARILAGLNHPHLARVWDHFRVGGKAYLVMDYIDGQTLEEIMKQAAGFLPEAAVLRWGGQLCDVLDYLHRQQPPVIFRDLKPSNVMLNKDDEIKLIDFGIARWFDPAKKTDTLKMGTAGYAPLEQYVGLGQTDARSDIYALGATLYHLLTGHEPEVAPARVLPGQPDALQPARAHNPRISPASEAALTKATAVDPAQRFQSAPEMKRALLERAQPRRGQGLRPFLLIAVAVLLIVVWAISIRPKPPPPPPPTPTPMPVVTPVQSATDGAFMFPVYTGEFIMGSSPEGEGDYDERPQHSVYLSAFWIYETEVTNEQFARFVDATGHRTDAEKDGWGKVLIGSEWKEIKGADWRHPDGPETTIADKMDHPVVQVSWNDAQAYCQWAGNRLPTESEWEKAARGMDGLTYPWGETFDGKKLNHDGADDGYQYTAPVGSYGAGASPYWALDMAGNVWEWCQDWYDHKYYARSPQRDPQGPDSGESRVLRGGSWDSPEKDVRAASRHANDPNDRHSSVGFRCASSMVYVPAGEFTMGSPEGEGYDDEHPQHTVYVSAFWIDQTEVMNEQFAQFVDATGHRTDAEKDGWGWGWTGSEWKQIEGADWRHPDGPETTIADKMDHPVVQVSWNDAQAYCEWAGKRVPTEAEWEKTARGTDGRTYPWGDAFDGSKVNFCDVHCEADWQDSGADDGYQRTAPVGSYPAGASPYGALDMAGNVWEWCQDWYDEDYYAHSPQRDPQGPDSGDYRVVRGGSWNNDEKFVRAANRDGSDPDFRNYFVGFRCVSQAP